jgi:hypothetical protein
VPLPSSPCIKQDKYEEEAMINVLDTNIDNNDTEEDNSNKNTEENKNDDDENDSDSNHDFICNYYHGRAVINCYDCYCKTMMCDNCHM